jgi:hypothetical protein
LDFGEPTGGCLPNQLRSRKIKVVPGPHPQNGVPEKQKLFIGPVAQIFSKSSVCESPEAENALEDCA